MATESPLFFGETAATQCGKLKSILANGCICSKTQDTAAKGSGEFESYGRMPFNGVGFTVMFSKNGGGVFDSPPPPKVKNGKQFLDLLAKVLSLFRYRKYFGE